MISRDINLYSDSIRQKLFCEIRLSLRLTATVNWKSETR